MTILLLFYLSILRLQFYESLFERDRQMKDPKIEDFSIYLENIPVEPQDYNNDQNLL